MKFSLIKPGSAALLASMILIAGCVPYPSAGTSPSTPASVSPSTPASGAPADSGKTRLYTKNVQPVMKTCSATSCHGGIPLGTYDKDKNIATSSRNYMLGAANLTADQTQVIKDWIAAGTPNDPTSRIVAMSFCEPRS